MCPANPSLSGPVRSRTGQIDESFHARMAAIDHRRIQQPRGSISNAVQQLAECR
jgi:hypothetical protein